jgi:hypothetical protein
MTVKVVFIINRWVNLIKVQKLYIVFGWIKAAYITIESDFHGILNIKGPSHKTASHSSKL